HRLDGHARVYPRRKRHGASQIRAARVAVVAVVAIAVEPVGVAAVAVARRGGIAAVPGPAMRLAVAQLAVIAPAPQTAVIAARIMSGGGALGVGRRVVQAAQRRALAARGL